MATEAEILAARRQRAELLRKTGAPLFPARVPRGLVRLPELLERFSALDAAALERAQSELAVAGRLLSIRSFGSAAFATLLSEGERLQLLVRKDALGAERFAGFRLYEIGDFVSASGRLLRSKTGELTLDVADLSFLAKAYRPLPEKWHGLADVEARYRQRYLDLLANPRAREIAVVRSRVVTAMRAFLDARGFLEVETPILHPLYGGANARPFVTHFNAYRQDVFLRISDELYLKRLLIGGLDRVYEIGRDFRNEGVDRKRNPEFSMLEVYQAYADYSDMMELVETLVPEVARRVLGTTRIERDGQSLELAGPWPRHELAALVRDACGVDIERATTLEALRDEVRAQAVEGVDPGEAPTWGKLVDVIFSAAVEPSLVQPTFVLDYPASISPLAKRREDRPDLVERFEAFIGGIEIANAFSELNDPDDQRARFEEQAEARRHGDLEAHPLDEDFLRALEHGMPPTGGLGMGIGRLVMMLTGAPSLREVKLFPYMRPRSD